MVQPVRDAREAEGLRFEDCGFTRLDSRSAVTDWTDSEQVDAIHGPEYREQALAFTGADHALVYPCIIRSPRMAEVVEDYAPIQAVHSDFTEDFGEDGHGPESSVPGLPPTGPRRQQVEL